MGGRVPRVSPSLILTRLISAQLPDMLLIKQLTYRSGVMCLSAPTSAEGHHFVEQAYHNCVASKLPCARLNNEADIKRAFAERLDAPAGGYEGKKGYLNTTGGWAESGRSLEVAIRMVRQLGGVVRGGYEVQGLIKDKSGKKVLGVKVKGEEDVLGDLVVVSTIQMELSWIRGARTVGYSRWWEVNADDQVTAGAWYVHNHHQLEARCCTLIVHILTARTPALCASEGMNVPIRDVVASG